MFLHSSDARRLRAEQLEDRRLLATVAVGNTLDVVNAPDTSSIAALTANDGGDGVSLREAILAANNTAGEDTVTFDAGVFAGGGTITLGGSQLQVAEGLTIDASGLTGPVAIDANQQSRVINFTADEGDLTLRGLTISGGRVTGFDEDGGGIRFGGSGLSGTLTLEQTTVTGNTALGGFADGGGVATLSGDLSLTESTVSGNLSNTSGGGLFADSGNVSIVSSTVSGNRTTIAQNTGNGVGGGGIGTVTGNVTLVSSTVSDNRTKTNGGALAPFQATSGSSTARSPAITATMTVAVFICSIFRQTLLW